LTVGEMVRAFRYVQSAVALLGQSLGDDGGVFLHGQPRLPSR
jgi:hypothetical protein